MFLFLVSFITFYAPLLTAAIRAVEELRRMGVKPSAPPVPLQQGCTEDLDEVLE